MPYAFKFDFAHRVLLCTYTGQLTDDELRAYYRDATHYMRRTDPEAAIADFTGVTAFAASSDTVQQLAASEPAMAQTAHPRFIVAPLDHVYGMSRMFQLAGESTRPSLYVVRSLQEVLSALGLKDLKFEDIPDE